ncbi:DoxX family membrane protein [Nocardioides sp.]|uniref:DoxX family membrane protein n=1 Tax=Nocardioides sp. TaxID=35761 RepID=UPI003D14F7C7
MTLIRTVARPMLASIFFLGAYSALRNPDATAAKAGKVTDRLVPLLQKAAPSAPIPQDPKTLVRINAAVQIGAAAALATGRAPRLSSSVLAVTLVPTTLAGHAFWEESEPAAKNAQRLGFFKNVSVLGGLLLAGVDTDGKPGLAWRARHAATAAKKETRRMARNARREAKLAKAQLT